MKNKKSMNIWIGSLTGFILSTLFVSVGFWKTILIIFITIIAALIGYLLEEYNVDLSIISKMFTRKN
ncbi:hypothetical protein GCM10025879_03060 [Leuconostoc litchii]|uniref:DUF2273 domain-containing protein n=1 Tax=Leuconostoc litchii TaxID=1981069 RepID=A0A6P2CQC3_9LACO|nr:DUF2273 domain-containing protein [Leuconostoc litchii]TYC47111.1 DUF2273 domain-containing protein [Leuconostoc litchii]GMA69060.1 hypothetical protein GCM10025879_03060 [Leuconostoc litchii]